MPSRAPGLLIIAITAITSACASARGVPRPFPQPGAAASTTLGPTPAPVIDTDALAATALALRGTPYRNGGRDPSGFDCSGFVQYVFGQHGIPMPRDVKEQFAAGERVKLDELERGDLIFFTTVAPGPSHVGLALGGGEFVHAPSSAGVVRTERLGAAYWSQRIVGARRLRN